VTAPFSPSCSLRSATLLVASHGAVGYASQGLCVGESLLLRGCATMPAGLGCAT